MLICTGLAAAVTGMFAIAAIAIVHGLRSFGQTGSDCVKCTTESMFGGVASHHAAYTGGFV